MEPIQRASRHPHGHSPKETLVSADMYQLPIHPAHSSGDQKQAREALKNAALVGTKVEAVLSSESKLVPMLISVKLLMEHSQKSR